MCFLINFGNKHILYSIGIQTNFFTLTAAVGSTVATGIVTYFDVEGQLEIPFIREKIQENI